MTNAESMAFALWVKSLVLDLTTRIETLEQLFAIPLIRMTVQSSQIQIANMAAQKLKTWNEYNVNATLSYVQWLA